jgi:hypothetical protein
MNSYELSRRFFDWSFENPDKINTNHIALYFFAIEHCNRLGWKEKFGLPTSMAKEAIGIKSYHTYKKTLDDLVEFGFIKMIEISKNQYSSNIIAIAEIDKAHVKAHVKALDKALTKHMSKQVQSTCQSNSSINKQYNNRTIEQVIEYFTENGYTKESAIKFFNYYEVANWEDSKGKEVKRWKQKAQGVWFKDENKIQEKPKDVKSIADQLIDFRGW